jgi:Secretion system C-terminal sorting domain
LQWIQDFGLVHFNFESSQQPGSSYESVDLISFNNQSVPIIASKNVNHMSPTNSMVFLDTRHQLHWRGLSATDHLSVQLFDFRGKLIYSSSQLSGSFILNTSHFSNGAYIIKYQINNETWKHFSFVRN